MLHRLVQILAWSLLAVAVALVTVAVVEGPPANADRGMSAEGGGESGLTVWPAGVRNESGAAPDVTDPDLAPDVAVETPVAPPLEPTAPVEPPAPAEPDRLIDLWFADYHDDVKTGWVHVWAVPGEDDGIELTEEHFSRSKDAITKLEHQSKMLFQCSMDADLVILGAKVTYTEIGERERVTTQTVTRDEAGYVVETVLDGRSQTKRCDAPEPVLGSNDILMLRLHREGKLVEGFEHTFRELDFGTPRPVEKTLQILGKKREGEEELIGVSFDTARIWLGEDGMLHHGVLGGTVVRRESEEQATAFDAGKLYTFQNEMISPLPIPGLPGADAVVVRFRVPRDERGDLFATNDYQEVLDVTEDGDAKIYRVRLRETAFGEPGADEPFDPRAELVEPPAALAEFLERDDPIRCADDPVVAAKAREITAGATTRREAVTLLADWIHHTLQKQYTAIGNLTARETLDGNSGDCSEHAILFDAFARSLGMPVKECSGYVFWDRRGGAHAWSQVLIDGEWVHVDCVGNLVGAPPQYLLFWRHEEGRPRDKTLGERLTLLRTRPIEIAVEAIEVGEQTFTTEQLERAGQVVDGRWESEPAGLAVMVPEGWRTNGRPSALEITLTGGGAFARMTVDTSTAENMIGQAKRAFEDFPDEDVTETKGGGPPVWWSSSLMRGSHETRFIVVALEQGCLFVQSQAAGAPAQESLEALLAGIEVGGERPFAPEPEPEPDPKPAEPEPDPKPAEPEPDPDPKPAEPEPDPKPADPEPDPKPAEPSSPGEGR